MIRRFALAAALALAASPVFAATYTLDPTHTQAVFSWNHFGYSNPTAQFGSIAGTLDFDAAKPTQAKVLSRLCDCLVPGGFLYVGHSETVTGISLPVRQVANTVFKKI